jgi:hypothetical protein
MMLDPLKLVVWIIALLFALSVWAVIILTITGGLR